MALLTAGASNNERGRLLRREAVLSASFEDLGDALEACPGRELSCPREPSKPIQSRNLGLT